jgi:hypothetical protein
MAAVGTGSTWGRRQEAVRLRLVSGLATSIGAFHYQFARQLRDKLKQEIEAQRADWRDRRKT